MLHATVAAVAGRHRPRGRFGAESAGVASAGTHVKPTITATQATFTIPSSPTGVWQLGLTTYPPPVTHLGKVRGTSGTLTLPVPQTATCSFQVDVKVEVTGTSTFVLYSSIKAVVPGLRAERHRSALHPRLLEEP
jgi:hypothetical protein